jgi:hypothetical protein
VVIEPARDYAAVEGLLSDLQLIKFLETIPVFIFNRRFYVMGSSGFGLTH